MERGLAAFAERGRRPGSLRLSLGVHPARGGRRLRPGHLGRRVPLPRSRLRPRRHRPLEVADPRHRGRPALCGDPAPRASSRARASSSSASGTPASRSRDGLEPWARQIFLVSPRPVQTAVLAHTRPSACATSSRWRTRPGAAARSRSTPPSSGSSARASGGFRLHAVGTTRPGPITPRGGRGDRGDRLPDAAAGPARARPRHRRRRQDPRADAATGRARRSQGSTSRGTRCRAPPACGRTASAAPRAP